MKMVVLQNCNGYRNDNFAFVNLVLLLVVLQFMASWTYFLEITCSLGSLEILESRTIKEIVRGSNISKY